MKFLISIHKTQFATQKNNFLKFATHKKQLAVLKNKLQLIILFPTGKINLQLVKSVCTRIKGLTTHKFIFLKSQIGTRNLQLSTCKL